MDVSAIGDETMGFIFATRAISMSLLGFLFVAIGRFLFIEYFSQRRRVGQFLALAQLLALGETEFVGEFPRRDLLAASGAHPLDKDSTAGQLDVFDRCVIGSRK